MMSKVLFLCLVLLLAPASAQFGWLNDLLGLSSSQKPADPTVLEEIQMDAPELITSKGYPCESHSVTTKDGYILTLHRIPHGHYNKDRRKSRPVALLQHGLVGSSNVWLMNPVNQTLAFALAEAGVDVWLGNNRGNAYSKRHRSLDPRRSKFWDFSWDEMAKYDLPAEINYILRKTRSTQLYYVGYSQGSAIGFAKFSEDKKLAKKVKHFIALAPIARVGHITSALRTLEPYSWEIKTFLNIFARGAMDTNPSAIKSMSTRLCNDLGEEVCMQGYTILMGDMNGRSINKSRMAIYNAQCPSSTSVKTLMHWAQGVKSNKFQHFDFGQIENFRRYKQRNPPLYDIRDLEVPVALFTGGSDALADPTDVSWLRSQIKNETHYINIGWYNHLALLVGIDAKDRIFPQLIRIITGRRWTPGN